jgi:hypothetical protein
MANGLLKQCFIYYQCRHIVPDGKHYIEYRLKYEQSQKCHGLPRDTSGFQAGGTGVLLVQQ